MKYIYFIAYCQRRGYDEGTGSIEVTRKKKLKTLKNYEKLKSL